MEVKDVNSNLIFVVEDKNNSLQNRVDAERGIPYAVMQHGTQTSE